MSDAFFGTDSQKRSSESALPGRDDISSQSVVTVYGYTNRHESKDHTRLLASNEPGGGIGETQFYKQTFRVNRQGAVEEDISRDGDIQFLNKEQLERELPESVSNGNGRLGIFVPGIRNAPGAAASDAAELASRSGETFLVADWQSSKPSENDTVFDIAKQTVRDYQSAAKSQPMIDSMTIELMQKMGADNIDLVAHSRGSTLTCNTLSVIEQLGLSPLRSVTFTHGDKPLTEFSNQLPRLIKAAKHMNFLVDKLDEALQISSFYRFLTSPVIDSHGHLFPSQETVGTFSTPEQLAADFAPRNYFTVRQEIGKGMFGHSPNMTNIKSVLNGTDEAGGMAQVNDQTVRQAALRN